MISRDQYPASKTKFDERPAWKRYYSKFMLGWAVLAHSWLVIQAVEIYTSKDASGVSMIGYIIYIISSIIWITYGAIVLEERNYVIMTSSTIALTLGIVTLVGVYKYGDNGTGGETLERKKVSFAINRFEQPRDEERCKSCFQSDVI